MSPRPPSARGVPFQARCENSESTLTPTTWTPRDSNSAMRSENATISVGQTNVKSPG
jgi:hypothetical protein